MLTLQSSFKYDDTSPPPVQTSQISIKYPQLALVPGSQPVEVGEGSVAFNQSLLSNVYSVTLPIDDVFGQDYGLSISKYISNLVQTNRNVLLSDFSVVFSAHYGTISSAGSPGGEDNDDLVESIWFLKLFRPLRESNVANLDQPQGINGPQSQLASADDGLRPSSSLLDRFSLAIFDRGDTSTIIDAAVNDNIYLVNKRVYLDLLAQLLPGTTILEENQPVLLYVINRLVDLTGNTPRLALDADANQRMEVDRLFAEFDLIPMDGAFEMIVQDFPKLFDFPITMPKLKLLDIKGYLKVNGPAGFQLTPKSASFYRLSAEYITTEGTPVVNRYTWDPARLPHDNQIDFSFTIDTALWNIGSRVTIKVKDFNNVDIFNQSFEASDDNLQNLKIVVDLRLPGRVGTSDDSGGVDLTKLLRGKLISLSKRCTMAGTVVLQAKRTSEESWTTVSTGTSDQEGNFTLPYPYGQFDSAQVLTSLDPNHQTELQVDGTSTNESMPTGFLFILLQDESGSTQDPQTPDTTTMGSTDAKKADCKCDTSVNAGRLPSQDDLIQSDQYMQDVGGCINLTTPNRTLREYNYTALVRHSDPDVATYSLSSVTDPDPMKASTVYKLTRVGKTTRGLIDVDNPVNWADVEEEKESLQLYQAVTVSTGHILYYKSEFRADGYSLGDLTYSLALAPGQKKQVVTTDFSHSLRAFETQSLSQSEQLASDLVNERDIVDQIGGGLGEQLAGQSSANTWGISAGGGAAGSSGFASGNVGVAGGTANASSSASQTSGRNVAGYFQESIKQGIHQNASSYRQQNSTVVTSVDDREHYSTETSVVANHNHCHSMTMLYFQVLRHFAVYQELTNVEECVFVPLIITRFGNENISRWADILATRLLPLSANTSRQLSSYTQGKPSHPLIPAFDAMERIKTNWALVDFPPGPYDMETIVDVQGSGVLTVDIPRPKTKYDFILSLPIVNQTVSTGSSGGFFGFLKSVALGPLSAFVGNDQSQTIQVRAAIFDLFMTMDPTYQTLPPAQCIRVNTFQPVSIKNPNTGDTIIVNPMDFIARDDTDHTVWDVCARLLNSTLGDMMDYYFKGQLLSDWDRIWRSSIAPQVFRALVKGVKIDVIGGTTYVPLGNYNGNGEANIPFSFDSGSLPKWRRDCEHLIIGMGSADPQRLDPTPVVFRIRSLRLVYSTPHFTGVLYNGSPNLDLLAPTMTDLYCPETSAERRDPKQDDLFITQKLIIHLNNNLEYYNRVLWYSLDPQRRFLLLDGFQIEVFNPSGSSAGYRSISSVVKSNLIAIIGNSLVFPVAPGYKVGRSFIEETNEEGEMISTSLLDFYKPATPPPPYRLSVPTRGIYSEALMGRCDTCEPLKPDSSQDWTKFTTDEPTAINPITAPVPEVTDYKPAIKDFASPMVSIQNAPALPEPGAGLNSALALLGKSDLFRDVAGLEANQANAMKTLLSNNESAKSYAQMASGMVMQAHNTANSSQMLDAMKQKKAEGAFDQATYSDLVKSHFQQQIDGGTSLNAQIEKEKAAAKPSLIDAAVAKASNGTSNVKASMVDSTGNAQSLDISDPAGGGSSTGPGPGTGSPKPTKTLAEVKDFPAEKQLKTKGCWAATLKMMFEWKEKRSMTVEKLLSRSTMLDLSGQKRWLTLYENNKGLSFPFFPDLMQDYNLMGEGPNVEFQPQAWADLINKYGPILVATDGDFTEGVVHHFWIMAKVECDAPPPGQQTTYWVTVVEPLPGRPPTIHMEFKHFQKQFEAMFNAIAARDSGWDFSYYQIIHFKDKISP